MAERPIADMRAEYVNAGLREADAHKDPIVQFRRWFDEATAAAEPEPNAMTLATADADGRPSARVVLLKDVDDRGFTFYTNYQSRKAQTLAECRTFDLHERCRPTSRSGATNFA